MAENKEMRVAGFDLEPESDMFNIFYHCPDLVLDPCVGVRQVWDFEMTRLIDIVADYEFEAAVIDCPGQTEQTLSQTTGDVKTLCEGLSMYGYAPVLVSPISSLSRTISSVRETLLTVGDAARHVVVKNMGLMDKKDFAAGGSGFPFFDGAKGNETGDVPAILSDLGGIVSAFPEFLEEDMVAMESHRLPFSLLPNGRALRGVDGINGPLSLAIRCAAKLREAKAGFGSVLEAEAKRARDVGLIPIFVFYNEKGGAGKSTTARFALEFLRGEI